MQIERVGEQQRITRTIRESTDLVNSAGFDVVPVTAVKSDDGGRVEAGLDYNIHHTFCCEICRLKSNNKL